MQYRLLSISLALVACLAITAGCGAKDKGADSIDSANKVVLAVPGMT